MTRTLLTSAALAALSSAAWAVPITETEANDSKATANVALLSPGDTITGNSTGASVTVAGTTSADYYTVSVPTAVPGIYRNRLTITTTGTAGHTGTIRGLGQTASNTTNTSGPGLPNATSLDNTLQTSPTTPSRFNQWYSFGAANAISYRVTGATATTADYVSTLSQDVITPVSLGSFQSGSITLTNTGLTSLQDTDILVYNSAFQPMADYLNDDFLDGTTVPTGGSTLNSLLTRTYAPGTYYVAISNFNTADNRFSPADEGTANATVLDFAGVVANGSTTTFTAIPFSIRDSAGTVNFSAVKPNAFDVYWASFTVVPEPTGLGLLGVAGLAALRRRRA